MADHDDDDLLDAEAAQMPGTSLLRSPQETAAIMRLSGESPPNQCEFHCNSCGWRGTLQFDEAELAALDDDPASYAGPCPGTEKKPCGRMTLIARANLIGDAMSAQKVADDRLRRQVKIAADTVAERIEKKIGDFVAGKMAEAIGGAPADDDAAEKDEDAPVDRDDLPDAADVLKGDLDEKDVK